MKPISLTASMRSNLLSLQNISGQVSSVQNQLSTGNKVNSAIDNPSSYYTASSLTNRANDLSALLDSMGQAVSTIRAATQGLEAGAELLAQASAVATQALEVNDIPPKAFFEQQEDVAAVVSSWDELKAALDSGKTGNIVIYGNIEAQDRIILQSGQNLVGVGHYGVTEPDIDKFSQLTFDLEKIGKSTAIIIQSGDLKLTDISIKGTAMTATASALISAQNDSNVSIHNTDIVFDVRQQGTYFSTHIDNNIIKQGNYALTGTNNLYAPSPSEDKTIILNVFYKSNLKIYDFLNLDIMVDGNRCFRASYADTYDDVTVNIRSHSFAIQDGVFNVNDNSKINIENGNTGSPITLYQDGAVYLNDNSTMNIAAPSCFRAAAATTPSTFAINSVSANLNLQTKTISANEKKLLTFKAPAGSIMSINSKVYEAKTDVEDNTMDKNTLPQGFKEVEGAVAPELPSLDWLSAQNAKRQIDDYRYTQPGTTNDQYSSILTQYDNLIQDAGYKGNNLLKGDDLGVRFNEVNSSNLDVKGKEMSGASLGLTTTDWSSSEGIAQSLKEIAVALSAIRSFNTELGNNYSIITNRQEFTENLINILTEGADKLVLADMNEESANMLALQTRQQLAINSLSLASQAAQGILKLFV